MSATILNENNFRGQLGLEKNKTVYISANSTFDHEKSPIIYKPIGKMNYQHINETLPKVISEIENIMNNYSNEKGIIHINSIKNSEFIYNNISNKLKKRILIKKENETNNDLIKRHMTNKKPTVILSSSLATGVDLKDDLSRFQIIVKLPWMSLMDEKVKCKIKTNPTWYSMEMLKHLIQMCGRSTRTEEDYSTTYILDNSFYKWTKKLRNNLPDYFLNRIIWDNKHHTNNFYN
jgi:Rad3-related DNA helicase